LLMYHRFANVTVDLALSGLGKQLYTFFNAKWFFDAVINHYIINKALGVGNITAKVIDRGAIELLGPFGLTNTLYGGSQSIAKLDTGVVTQYALYIMIGLIAITLLLFVPILSGLSLDNIGDLRLVVIYIAGLLFITTSSSSSNHTT
jgi:NADH-ubiquinone oxidoreductase chain 5